MRKSRFNLDPHPVLLPTPPKRESSLCVIAMEGGKKEVNYFEKFGSSKIKVVPLPPISGDSNEPKGILASLLKYKSDNDIGDEDACWLVFDVDHRANKEISGVCKTAREQGFAVAISNPCFEFWLFLHKFDVENLPPSTDSAENRAKEMKAILGDSYQFENSPYHAFREEVADAVRRARAHRQGQGGLIPTFPGTDVYKVVETLPVKNP